MERRQPRTTLAFFFILATIVLLLVVTFGPEPSHAWGDATKSRSSKKQPLHVGLIAPHTNFGKREYLRAINSAVNGLAKGRGTKLTFLANYDFTVQNVHFDMMSLTPSPTGKTSAFFLTI